MMQTSAATSPAASIIYHHRHQRVPACNLSPPARGEYRHSRGGGLNAQLSLPPPHRPGSTLTGVGYIGGITGYLESDNTGVACLVTDTEIGGTPGGNPCFGGIAGRSGSRLVACVSTAKTTLTHTEVGSITGMNNNAGTLSACYWQTGNGFGRAIGYDWNASNPQEAGCTGFAAGTFTAEYVVALNAAITAYNDGQSDEALKCKFRWKVAETTRGLETVK